MRYITPRKAAQGLGSAHQGTLHHWAMTVTAVALLILTPLFMIVVARAIGLPHQQLLVYFGRPIPALITSLAGAAVRAWAVARAAATGPTPLTITRAARSRRCAASPRVATTIRTSGLGASGAAGDMGMRSG